MSRTIIIGGSKGLGAEIKEQLETNCLNKVVTLCRGGDVYLNLGIAETDIDPIS